MEWSLSTPLELADEQLAQVRAALPLAAAHAIQTIRDKVPTYGPEVQDSQLQRAVERAVSFTLRSFIDAAAGVRDAGGALEPAIRGAYGLGRNEAQVGRPLEAIQAAYRIGGRACWEGMGAALLAIDVTPKDIVALSGALFDYMDQLAMATASGYASEVEKTFRERHQHREALARALISGTTTEDALVKAAQTADWTPPETLTAVLVKEAHAADLRPWMDQRALLTAGANRTIILVPDVAGQPARDQLADQLQGRRAIVGPTVPWMEASVSWQLATRLTLLVESGIATGDPVRAEDFQVQLVVHADEPSHAELRERMLEPLQPVRPATRERLIETLRAWLLHALADNRREAVAEALFVHPQTVRYRIGQLRDLYGERLSDPEYVRDLVVALT